MSSVIVNLFGLQGEMSTKGFLSSVGIYPGQVATEDDSLFNVNMRRPPLFCIVG